MDTEHILLQALAVVLQVSLYPLVAGARIVPLNSYLYFVQCRRRMAQLLRVFGRGIKKIWRTGIAVSRQIAGGQSMTIYAPFNASDDAVA
jgi:hypothetical protein